MSQYLTDEPIDLWMVLRAITMVDRWESVQSVQLAVTSAQQCPSRLMDERNKGWTTSCFPLYLASRHHAGLKDQLTRSLVSCCDSSFVNVLTWPFKCRYLTSLWLKFLPWGFFFWSHIPGTSLETPPSLPISGCPHIFMLHFQFVSHKNLNNCQNKWASPPSVLIFFLDTLRFGARRSCSPA